MRFSAAFTFPLPLVVRAAQPAEPVRVDAAVPPTAAAQAGSASGRESAQPDLPDDLDARVRLIGEWQLGEAD